VERLKKIQQGVRKCLYAINCLRERKEKQSQSIENGWWTSQFNNSFDDIDEIRSKEIPG